MNLQQYINDRIKAKTGGKLVTVGGKTQEKLDKLSEELQDKIMELFEKYSGAGIEKTAKKSVKKVAK